MTGNPFNCGTKGFENFTRAGASHRHTFILVKRPLPQNSQASVLEGTSRTGYTLMKFIAKSLWDMEILWSRMGLTWHRGVVYGPLLALI